VSYNSDPEMDSTTHTLSTGKTDPSHREQLVPEGDPSLGPQFLPVHQSLVQLNAWCRNEFQLSAVLLFWVVMQPRWRDFRLTVCQVALLGSTVLLLYGTTQWTRLFHAIDWTGPSEAIQSALEKMRAIRLRQLGLTAVLLPPILTSATLLLIQSTNNFADTPGSSVFTALEPWSPLLLLAVIVAMVLMWRFARRQLQEGWHDHHWRQQLVDGGSEEVLDRVLTNSVPRDTPAEPAHVAMGSGGATVESPPSLAQNGSPPLETAHGSVCPQPPARRIPMLDMEEFRESILQPVRTRQRQFVVWPLIEIVCSFGVLLFCVAKSGRWADPRLFLCLGIGIAIGLAYLTFHCIWLHGAFSLDWNGPLEEIQATLERLRIIRIRHLRWSPVILMGAGQCVALALIQRTFDPWTGSSQSVFEHASFWRTPGLILLFMFVAWFYAIPFERLAYMRSSGGRSRGDGGVLAAFDRARREIERWRRLHDEESVHRAL
jgi:hypothetical protein